MTHKLQQWLHWKWYGTIWQRIRKKFNKVRADLTSKIDHVDIKTTKRFEDIAASAADTNNELMRMKRLSELLLLWLPFFDNEDLRSVFTTICAKINYGGANAQCSIFRLGKSTVHDKPAAILLRFLHQTSAIKFMKAYFEFKTGLNTTDIGFSTSRRIYVRHNLSPLFNQIHTKCLEFKCAPKIHSVLVFDGFVYVRKPRDSAKSKIQSMTAFDSLVAEVGKPENNIQRPVHQTDSAKFKRKSSASPPFTKHANKHHARTDFYRDDTSACSWT